jgi:hypothetical protein
VTGFPLVPLGIIVEIYVNGAWNDISDFVYNRDDISITGGAPDGVTKPSSAQLTLTLNNSDGRFSPNYTGGAYYPYLQRSTQIRVSVNSQSINNTTYNGYRFWGSVTDWPPNSDISNTDIFVPITATGPFRYIRQGGGEGSALTRYYQTLTGTYAPIAYWPAEEDNLSTSIGTGLSGGLTMSVSGTPKWKTVSSFNGSAPIGVLNGSTWTGVTGSFGSSGNDVFNTPGTYQWIASTTTGTYKIWNGGGGGGNGPGCGGAGSGYTTGTFATTIGQQYTVVVGQGGNGGLGSSGAFNNGQAGGVSSFTDNSSTHTGGTAPGGGQGGIPGTGPTGGVGSSFTGGSGGAVLSGTPEAGAGGGSSAGTAANGNAGGTASHNSPGSGGSAPTGGAAGGNGAAGPQGNGTAGGVPGGGGAGGCTNPNTGYLRAGAPGGSGTVQLTYTPSSSPPWNVFRFILYVPKHGGNNGKVLTRWLTGGTIARWDVQYVTGGKIQVLGYNSGNTLLFTSGQLTIGDNQTAMVSVEATNSGTSVNYTLTAVKPGIGQKKIGTVTGTQTTASVGNCSELIVAPNGDITKTAMGHFSVQYAFIDLTHVAAALDGHTSEMTVDRFIRLMSEEGYSGVEVIQNEGADHWGFEAGTQSWVGTNAALSSVTSPTLFPGFIVGMAPTNNNTGDLGSGQTNWWNWPADGTHSLSIVANGAGAVTASSPTGTSGQPVNAGDVCSVAFDVYTPTAVSGLSCNINFYNSSGTFLSSVSTALDTPTTAGEIQTVKVTTGSGGAPTNAAFLSVSITSSGTLTNGTTFYVDNVRIGPRMTSQTRKRLHDLTEELHDLEQGMRKESKKLWGLGFRTRISMLSQAVAVTLSYTAAQLGDTPQPVIDNLQTTNEITVKKHKGSKVTVSLNSGTNSVSQPPNGIGKFKRTLKTVAEIDAQLLALANHILTIGTAGNERYPTVVVDMTRTEVASLFNAVPSAGPGDYIQLTNLPFWYPSSTAKQLITGYSELLNTYKWTITWNCTPESPFEITSTIRRW